MTVKIVKMDIANYVSKVGELVNQSTKYNTKLDRTSITNLVLLLHLDKLSSWASTKLGDEDFPITQEDVDFAGPFKKEEISTVFSKMTISNTLRDFSRTGSPNGSFGVLKIFESMEAGLPVLLSDVKCYREIVEKYNCGICVDPHNSQQIKEAIQYLVENKEMAYQMGQNGRRAVLEEYNWESQAKLYIEVLTNI